MKRELAIFLVGCTLLLAACAGLAASDPAPPAGQPEVQAVQAAPEEFEEPEYEVVPLVYGSQFRSEDEKQKVVAQYNYQVVLLSLHNADEVSPADREAAERCIETFNSKMRSVGEDLVEQGKAMAADALEAYSEFGSLAAEYEDGAEIGVVFCGDIISACLRRSSFTGGAHPNRYAGSYLFDLSAGQFIDPTQAAGDPEAFRTGAAELLLEKAESHAARDAFWEDYAEVIAHWNRGTVQFTDEGMQVTYSPYELGPYAIGEVELLLDWKELEPLLGPDGMARLGRGEAAE